MKKKNYNQIFRIDAKRVFFEVSDSSFGIDRVKFLFKELDQNHKEKFKIEYYLDMPDFFYLVEVLNNPTLPSVVKKYVSEEKIYTPIWQVEGGKTAEKLKAKGESRKDGKAAAWRLKILPSPKEKSIMLQVEIGAGSESNTGGVVFQGKVEKFIGVPVEIEKLKSMFKYTMLYVNGYYNAYTAVKYEYDANQRVSKEKNKFWKPKEQNS